MANTKITKKDMYNEIITLCGDRADIVDFCYHEIELLEKKANKTSSKKDNDHIKVMDIIYYALEEVAKPVTITDLMKLVPSVADYSNQKISAMLKKMVENGTVDKKVEKKKSYFSLATVKPTEDVE